MDSITTEVHILVYGRKYTLDEEQINRLLHGIECAYNNLVDLFTQLWKIFAHSLQELSHKILECFEVITNTFKTLNECEDEDIVTSKEFKYHIDTYNKFDGYKSATQRPLKHVPYLARRY